MKALARHVNDAASQAVEVEGGSVIIQATAFAKAHLGTPANGATEQILLDPTPGDEPSDWMIFTLIYYAEKGEWEVIK